MDPRWAAAALRPPGSERRGTADRRARLDRRSGVERRRGRPRSPDGDRRVQAERRAFDRRALNRPEFLADFDSTELRRIAGFFPTEHFQKGRLVVQAGSVDTSLYLVTGGRFEVLVPGPDGPQSAGLILHGEVFGELSFFDAEPRSADVMALEDSEAVVISRAGLARLRLVHPDLAFDLILKMASVATRRFRAHNRELASRGLIMPRSAW